MNRGLQYFLLHIGQKLESYSLARPIITLPRLQSLFLSEDGGVGLAFQAVKIYVSAEPATASHVFAKK